MRLTNETINKVDKAYIAIKHEANKRICANNVTLVDSIDGTRVAINGYGVANIDTLSELIDQLTITKQAIEKVTGIILE